MSNSLNRANRRKRMVTDKQINTMVAMREREIKNEWIDDIVGMVNRDWEERVFISFALALHRLYGFSGKRIYDVYTTADEIRGEMEDKDKFTEYQSYLANRCGIAYREP